MTEVREEAREGSSLAAAPPEGKAESAQRANSITQPSSVALDAVTRSARWVRARVARLLDRPESRDGGRSGFPQAREWHHKCAGYYGVPVVRWLRLAWGYAHLLLVKSLTDFTEWVTESPARAIVTVAVFLAIWYGR